MLADAGPIISAQVLGYAFVTVNKLVLHIVKVAVDLGNRRNGIGSRLIKVPRDRLLPIHKRTYVAAEPVLCSCTRNTNPVGDLDPRKL